MTGQTALSQARHISNLLGGRTRTAEILQWPLTKIDSALRSGFFRCQDHEHILKRAWLYDVPMNELDFVVHLRGLPRPVPANERTAALS